MPNLNERDEKFLSRLEEWAKSHEGWLTTWAAAVVCQFPHRDAYETLCRARDAGRIEHELDETDEGERLNVWRIKAAA